MNVLPLNILVPELGAAPLEILPYARCLLDSFGGHATLLSVVEVPEDRSLSEGALTARRRRARLKKLADQEGNTAFRAEVRTAHSYGEAVRNAVEENNINLMLLPWRSTRHRPPR